VNLLLDLGNSRLKWGIFENNQLQIEQTLTHFEITSQKLHTFWHDFRPEKIGISSVGKAEILNIITSVAQELWNDVPIHFATSQAEFFDVKNSYLQPEKLGVDRFLALCAARQKTRFPICVVDCGTAITVDVLNENGEHQGGLICGGLTLMKNALAANTADLPFVNAVQKTGLAIETEAAIFNGTLFSACGLIEKVMQTQSSDTKLFLTGGDAEIISSHINLPFILEKNLVLEGLNHILNAK
jgi:type III pantothenate kinase